MSTRDSAKTGRPDAAPQPRTILLQSRPDAGEAAPSAWPVSLLWAPGSMRETVALSQAAVADLALERVVQALDASGRHAGKIRATLLALCADPADISYRQEIVADLLASPPLLAALREALPRLAALQVAGGMNWGGSESPLVPVMQRLGELDAYVECVDTLRGVLDGANGLSSHGLLALREGIREFAEDPQVRALREQLPGLQELIGAASSVTIGVNLGQDLQPESITIVELHPYPFKGPRSLVGRLLPSKKDGGRAGRTALRQVGPVALRKNSELYRDLSALLEAATAPLAQALAAFRDVSTAPLAALEGELAYFLGAASLFARLQAEGIPICCPEVAPPEERAFEVRDGANLTLGLQLLGDAEAGEPLSNRLVLNDAAWEPGMRLLILTGPNRGGKTTYCRAIGQAQVLFQAGLYVAGNHARLSPCDGIWTHFPLPEVDVPGGGRLDEEVERLRRIFSEATPAAIIILNEPLTSTSEQGALHIATDMVRALQLLGARAILVTHLHDLARRIPELNERAPTGCGIQSLVATAAVEGDLVRSTFRIVPGAAIGRSYASEIARQHGMTYEQLEELLRGRAEQAALPESGE